MNFRVDKDEIATNSRNDISPQFTLQLIPNKNGEDCEAKSVYSGIMNIQFASNSFKIMVVKDIITSLKHSSNRDEQSDSISRLNPDSEGDKLPDCNLPVLPHLQV